MTYAEAMFPRGGEVGGFALLPLTLGHALLLERLGCPLMPNGARREAGAGDIALLIWICQRPWDVAFRSAGRRWARWRRAWIAGRIAPRLAIARLEAQIYIGEQMRGPKVSVVTDAREMEAPALGALKVALMAELHVTEADALDRPLQATGWDLAIQAERHGLVELTGRQTEDAIEAARALAAANAAAANAAAGDGPTETEAPCG